MLKRIISHKICNPFTMEYRQYRVDPIMAIMNTLSGAGRSCARSPIQSGSSRYWELGSLKDKNVCIGGIGPIQLGSNYKMAGIIDYSNKKPNKIQVEIIDCPKLLTTEVAKSFPSIRHKNKLRIIKLFYNNYSDQKRGQFECLVFASDICERLVNDGHFAFYSGGAVKDASIFVHRNSVFWNENNEHVHATVILKNGYMHIDSLAADDVGIIYTDRYFDCEGFEKWIKDKDSYVK